MKENICCVTSCDQPLDQQYWDSQWQSQTIGWDLHEPAPQLVAIINTFADKNAPILIPGCGSAYEAEYLVSQGFQNITLIDISPTASDILKEKFKNNPEVTVICQDFFLHEGQYQYIIEQTFFCALPPYMRPRYVWKMHQLLLPSGHLAGLMFDRTFEVSPPFGGSEAEYRTLFDSSFDIITMHPSSLSVAPRMGSEIVVDMQRIDTSLVNLYSMDGITCQGCKSTVTDIFSKLEGVLHVSMSSDFSEVLLVSTDEIPLTTLQDKVSYESHYHIDQYTPNTLS